MSSIVLDDSDFKKLIAGKIVQKPFLDRTVRILVKYTVSHEMMQKMLFSEMYSAGELDSVDKNTTLISSPVKIGQSFIDKCNCGHPIIKHTHLPNPITCDMCETKRKFKSNKE